MKKKRIIYFVTLSRNAEIVLKQALDMSNDHEVMIFFDLDGARILDPSYLKQQARQQIVDVTDLLHKSIKAGIRLFGCQMNVMNAGGMKMMDGVELAGVATFLDLSYDADAVPSEGLGYLSNALNDFGAASISELLVIASELGVRFAVVDTDAIERNIQSNHAFESVPIKWILNEAASADLFVHF